MRAVIYKRVSEDDKKNKRSISQQEQESRTACEREGWTVDAVFDDNDRSASRHARRARPGYAELIEHLRSGRADVLVLWESSRGDRELERWAGLLNLCRNLGIGIHIVTHHRTYDLSVPRDWRTLAEDGVDSAYESEKTRERVLRDMRANAEQGRPHGKLLYGYRRTYDARGNFVSQDVDEDQAAIVLDAAKRVEARESLYEIANDYNGRGIPAPRGGSWDPTQIKRLCVNPAYIGKRVHRGEIIGDGVWPAILSESLYWTAHAILTDPARNNVRDRSIKHLLSGIAKCGVCEGPMRVLPNRGNLSYLCESGFCVTIKESMLDAFIEKTVRERIFKLEVSEIPDAQADQTRKAARAELAELEQRLEEFTTEAALGRLSAARLSKVEAKLQPLIDDARRRTKVVGSNKLLYKVVENPQLWDDGTVVERREILDALGFVIHVDKIGRGRRNYEAGERVRITWPSATRPSTVD